jgi:hypothetical protein
MEVWKADSLQLVIDPLLNGPTDRPATLSEQRNQLYEEGFNSDDYELAIALTPKGPQVTIDWAPLGRPTGLIADALLAVRHTGKHVVYEMALPWAAFGIKPSPDQPIGIDLLVNDSDGGDRHTLGWAKAIADGKYPSRFVPLALMP